MPSFLNSFLCFTLFCEHKLFDSLFDFMCFINSYPRNQLSNISLFATRRQKSFIGIIFQINNNNHLNRRVESCSKERVNFEMNQEMQRVT